MYKLRIDTSDREKYTLELINPQGSVVEKRDGKFDVVEVTKEVLKKNGLEVSQVEAVEANKGPGSYTGLRAGLAFANVFNWIRGRISHTQGVLPEYGAEPNITPPKKVTF